MVKKYIRFCDCCEKEIPNMYEYGVTTLYRNIRIGRGARFKDYCDSSICNQMDEENPKDYDNYGKGYKSDDEREFSFCSPDCLYNFLGKLYENTYIESLKNLNKLGAHAEVIEDLKKRKSMNPLKKFFDRSKNNYWLDSSLEELEEQKQQINKKIKDIKKLKNEKFKRTN